MSKNIRKLLNSILVGGADESVLCPGFVKIYAKQDQERLLNRFVEEYELQCSEFMESVRGFQMKEGDWEFDEYPKGVPKQQCLILEDGILINLDVISMLIYGRDVLSFWNFSFSCVTDTIELLSKEFGELQYEGVVTLYDETTSSVSDEGAVSSFVIGNVADYGFTVKKVLENMCTRELGNLHLDEFLELCDCEEANQCKPQILAVLSSWHNGIVDPDSYGFGLYYLEENYGADTNDITNWITHYILSRNYVNADTAALLAEACAEMSKPRRKPAFKWLRRLQDTIKTFIRK